MIKLFSNSIYHCYAMRLHHPPPTSSTTRPPPPPQPTHTIHPAPPTSRPHPLTTCLVWSWHQGKFQSWANWLHVLLRADTMAATKASEATPQPTAVSRALTTRRWPSDHLPDKRWDRITHPFPMCNGCSVELWEWTYNCMPHIIMV